MKGMNVSMKISLHSEKLHHFLNKLTSSYPKSPSLWWFWKSVSSMGVICGDICATSYSLRLENAEIASIGKYLHSSGAFSSSTNNGCKACGNLSSN